MDEVAHPLTPAHMPSFITPPGESDTLLVVVGVIVLLLIIAVGLLYWRLHALPEQLSHRSKNKAQFEIVAVLALLALFTHNTGYWVAALILAMIPLPDIMTPLSTMSSALSDVAKGLWHRNATDTAGATSSASAPAPSPDQGTEPAQPLQAKV